MSLMSCASGESTWRGYSYFLERRAKITQKTSSSQYDGAVSGSNGAAYTVHIDLEHVRKSSSSTCRWQAEEEESKVLSFVNGRKKAELQEILMRLLYEGSEWQWERFVREYIE